MWYDKKSTTQRLKPAVLHLLGVDADAEDAAGGGGVQFRSLSTNRKDVSEEFQTITVSDLHS